MYYIRQQYQRRGAYRREREEKQATSQEICPRSLLPYKLMPKLFG